MWDSHTVIFAWLVISLATSGLWHSIWVFACSFWTWANHSCVWFGLVLQSDWIGNQQSIQITPTHMEIDVSVTQFDTRTGHIHFFCLAAQQQQKKRWGAWFATRFHFIYFHNQIHHERNIAVLCTFIFIRCQWTCDVRVRMWECIFYRRVALIHCADHVWMLWSIEIEKPR